MTNTQKIEAFAKTAHELFKVNGWTWTNTGEFKVPSLADIEMQCTRLYATAAEEKATWASGRIEARYCPDGSISLRVVPLETYLL